MAAVACSAGSPLLSTNSNNVFQKHNTVVESSPASRLPITTASFPNISSSLRDISDRDEVMQSRASGLGRRAILEGAAVVAAAALLVDQKNLNNAQASSLPQSDDSNLRICSEACEAALEKAELVTTKSGLQYKDIVEGKGPSPVVGFQVATNYVAMLPNGKVFGSSLEKGAPNIFRVGAGQVIAGLDEGLLGMKVGGIRRFYIPGELAFPKGLTSAPGRPRVPPSSPVVFDVELLYVPGLSEVEEL